MRQFSRSVLWAPVRHAPDEKVSTVSCRLDLFVACTYAYHLLLHFIKCDSETIADMDMYMYSNCTLKRELPLEQAMIVADSD